ncbi:hypothetical protein CEN49_11725 [Fischerella thermalis CCMEE 5273]|uniref:Uncharacterized protein n=1 Tax=Fischerella thermalis CCMEE 5330 TaxID=2019670 RepID=A0A2N6MEU9_9CYAN|nr:hypothetical protein CBP18_17280 [Fischerella thermalis WC119]PLZ07506.1 hypothetical protein CBP17_17005 [Fischerella thermalis WC114]PLZ18197.1 hypothetical protein CBP30_17570 [Fischerella thermalis WC157]PLZ35702.1 hypothetical protein CBP10_02920 [Fischerella thermalis WC558]PLZ47267.1 hypothetical protein CBP15_21005 [Fischerella thermalis WC442]PLZ56783.1 hypothetical protein CBP24_11320 [Fischerella thermalis WC439]PLZ68370.1 hypothetical protein CBP21_13010 [Fischerella thermalis 
MRLGIGNWNWGVGIGEWGVGSREQGSGSRGLMFYLSFPFPCLPCPLFRSPIPYPRSPNHL